MKTVRKATRKRSSREPVNKSNGRGAAVSKTAPIRVFSRSLPMALLRAREAVMQHFRASLRKHDLTEQQWRVLRALNTVDEIEVTDLARRTFLRGPSLTRILRDLEGRDLIARRPSDDDLRYGLVSINTSGLKLIEIVGPESEAIYAEISRRIGKQELERIESMLVRLEKALSEPIEL